MKHVSSGRLHGGYAVAEPHADCSIDSALYRTTTILAGDIVLQGSSRHDTIGIKVVSDFVAQGDLVERRIVSVR